MSAVIQRFFDLALDASRIESECYELPIEPAYEAVLCHVLAHPESKSEFIDAFIEIAHDPGLAPPQLIEYCMHELRWDDLRRYFSSWLEYERSERIRHVIRKFLKAFDDDWPDAGSYTRFGGDDVL